MRGDVSATALTRRPSTRAVTARPAPPRDEARGRTCSGGDRADGQIGRLQAGRQHVDGVIDDHDLADNVGEPAELGEDAAHGRQAIGDAVAHCRSAMDAAWQIALWLGHVTVAGLRSGRAPSRRVDDAGSSGFGCLGRTRGAQSPRVPLRHEAVRDDRESRQFDDGPIGQRDAGGLVGAGVAPRSRPNAGGSCSRVITGRQRFRGRVDKYVV